jgi:hypothetical protein
MKKRMRVKEKKKKGNQKDDWHSFLTHEENRRMRTLGSIKSTKERWCVQWNVTVKWREKEVKITGAGMVKNLCHQYQQIEFKWESRKIFETRQEKRWLCFDKNRQFSVPNRNRNRAFNKLKKRQVMCQVKICCKMKKMEIKTKGEVMV